MNGHLHCQLHPSQDQTKAVNKQTYRQPATIICTFRNNIRIQNKEKCCLSNSVANL